jgi:general L-amino acid transport system permease protein
MNSKNYSESRKPPIATTGILGWVRMNLFSNWFNSLLTILLLYFLYQIIPPFLNWAIFSADFTHNYLGELVIDRTFCTRVLEPELGGACWSIIFVRFYQFVYGFYPAEEVWRVNIVYFLLVIAILPLLFEKFPKRKYFLYFTYIFPVIAYILLAGRFGSPIFGRNIG